MIKNLVDLNDTLNVVARYIPVNTRNQIKGRYHGLMVRMTNNHNNYANNLNEWVEIIKQMVDEAQPKSLLSREINDLNFFLKKLEEKQDELSKKQQHMQNAYQTKVASGTIADRYF